MEVYQAKICIGTIWRSAHFHENLTYMDAGEKRMSKTLSTLGNSGTSRRNRQINANAGKIWQIPQQTYAQHASGPQTKVASGLASPMHQVTTSVRA